MAKQQKFDREKDMYEDVANGDGDFAYEEIHYGMHESYYETVSGEGYYETLNGESDNSKVRYVNYKIDNTMQGSYDDTRLDGKAPYVRIYPPNNYDDVQQQSGDYLPMGI
jgi:hypothetical protein